MNYPLAFKARQALRDEIHGRLTRSAERQAAATSRSMRCSGELAFGQPAHAGQPDGCKNDGTTCLCPCHDQASQ